MSNSYSYSASASDPVDAWYKYQAVKRQNALDKIAKQNAKYGWLKQIGGVGATLGLAKLLENKKDAGGSQSQAELLAQAMSGYPDNPTDQQQALMSIGTPSSGVFNPEGISPDSYGGIDMRTLPGLGESAPESSSMFGDFGSWFSNLF